MVPPLLRRLLRGAPVAALLAVGLSACADPTEPAQDEPAPAASSTGSAAAPTTTAPTTTTPTTTTPAGRTPTGAPPPLADGAGSEGLTVRHLDHGTLRTVRVEDFPR